MNSIAVADGEPCFFRVSSGRRLPSSFSFPLRYVDPDLRIRAASLQPTGKGVIGQKTSFYSFLSQDIRLDMLCFGKLRLSMTVGEALESFDIRCSTVLFLLALSYESDRRILFAFCEVTAGGRSTCAGTWAKYRSGGKVSSRL